MKWSRLEFSGIHVNILQRGGVFSILKNVDVSLVPGEVLGIVGESGAGKTLLMRSVAELLRRRLQGQKHGTRERAGHLSAPYILSGSVQAEPRQAAPSAAIIHQRVQESLNPSLRVGETLAEVLRVQKNGRNAHLSAKEVEARLVEQLEAVQLASTQEFRQRYVHELSGGMLQRLAIACVLAADTDVIIADESLSALDEKTSEGLVRLFRQIAQNLAKAVVIVSHNLKLLEDLSDRVVMLYAGHCVEQGRTSEFFARQRHPYSRALVDSDPRNLFKAIPGDLAPAGTRFRGCPFVSRCPRAEEDCTRGLPAVRRQGSSEFRCLHPQE